LWAAGEQCQLESRYQRCVHTFGATAPLRLQESVVMTRQFFFWEAQALCGTQIGAGSADCVLRWMESTSQATRIRAASCHVFASVADSPFDAGSYCILYHLACHTSAHPTTSRHMTQQRIWKLHRCVRVSVTGFRNALRMLAWGAKVSAGEALAMGLADMVSANA
jgi:hypothetical protein